MHDSYARRDAYCLRDVEGGNNHQADNIQLDSLVWYDHHTKL